MPQILEMLKYNVNFNQYLGDLHRVAAFISLQVSQYSFAEYSHLDTVFCTNNRK